MVFSMLSTKIHRVTTSNIEDDIIKQAINYINKNLSNELSIETIANALYCSKMSLNRNFRKIMGCTVWEYVVRRRIFSSRQRLFLSGNVNEAYSKSGFNDYSSFFRAYKKVIGIGPCEDLKKLQIKKSPPSIWRRAFKFLTEHNSFKRINLRLRYTDIVYQIMLYRWL